jgi:hypothetical protein
LNLKQSVYPLYQRFQPVPPPGTLAPAISASFHNLVLSNSNAEYLPSLLSESLLQQAYGLIKASRRTLELGGDEREQTPLCLYHGPKADEYSQLHAGFIHLRHMLTLARHICGMTQALTELLDIIDDASDTIPPHLGFQDNLWSSHALQIDADHSPDTPPALTTGLGTDVTLSPVSNSEEEPHECLDPGGTGQRQAVVESDQNFLDAVDLCLLLAGGKV